MQHYVAELISVCPLRREVRGPSSTQMSVVREELEENLAAGSYSRQCVRTFGAEDPAVGCVGVGT